MRYDIDDRELAAARVLASLDTPWTDGLSEDEDDGFVATIGS